MEVQHQEMDEPVDVVISAHSLWGQQTPPNRPPTFFLQSLDLARHVSFMRSVPTMQRRVSLSTRWSLVALFMHNLSTLGQNVVFGGGGGMSPRVEVAHKESSTKSENVAIVKM